MVNDRKRFFGDVKRLVVKVGSGVLTRDHGLNIEAVTAITTQISRLIDDGLEVILVSSGAMASGVRKIGLPRRPDETPERQAAAAVGQATVILEYEKAFSRFDRKVAQILLTSDDLSSRKRYLNARNTLNTLLSWGIIPIINENDTVAVEEITLGDNDNLGAMITMLMDADLMVNLTDIDGLYDRDPRNDPDAELIPVVRTFHKSLEEVASGLPGALGTGGMLSKIKAARKLTLAGIPMVIARGLAPDILSDLFSGSELGTFFVPKREKLPSRKCWIASALKPKGTLAIDAGAENALVAQGKSLLPSGITNVTGEFGIGAPVEFTKEDGTLIGIGLTNYSANDIRVIMGLKTSEIKARLNYKPYDEVIHRDNLAITAFCTIN